MIPSRVNRKAVRAFKVKTSPAETLRGNRVVEQMPAAKATGSQA